MNNAKRYKCTFDVNSGREAGIRSGSEEQAREKGREKREVKRGWSERRSADWFTIPWIHADYLTVLTEWDRGICKGRRERLAGVWRKRVEWMEEEKTS